MRTYSSNSTERRLLTGIFLATSALSGPAFAQAQQAQPAATTGEQGIETVVVTAEKRSQRLIDVAASISVVKASDIQDANLTQLSDIAAQVPNVVMQGSSTFPNITIRGVGSSSGVGTGTQSQTGVDPAVVVYVDDVYQGRERAENIPLFGIDQVEVLRGPQGTLYGENTIGGAINITTKKPTDAFEAEGDAQVGNLGYEELFGSVSGPVVDDKLLVLVSGSYQNRDGYIHNTFDNRNLDYDRDLSGRVRAIYEATSRLTFDFSADYLHDNDTESLLTTEYEDLPIPPFTSLPPIPPGTRDESLNSPEFGRRTVYGGSARADYDFDGARLTSISAYRAYTSEYAFDSDGSPLSLDKMHDTDDANLFTQELRLTSTGDGALKWIVGGYFSHQRLDDNFMVTYLDQFPTVLLGLPALPAGYSDAGTSIGHIIDNSYAAFASGTYDFSPQLELSAGIRYTNDSKTLHFSQGSTDLDAHGYPFALYNLIEVPIPSHIESLNESVPTGDISLSYKFTPDQVAYIKFSRGYKAGGFNASDITPPYIAGSSLAFRPEYLNNYEAGYKGAWWDGRLTANASVFYDDYTNKQETVENPAILSVIIRNAASAVTYGAEFEAAVQPMDGLTFDGTLGLLNAHYVSFPNGGGIGISYNGNQLPNAPHWQGTISGQYEHALPDWSGFYGLARLELVHSDSSFFDPNNTVAYEQKPYTYLNGRIGVENEHWGFYVWGNNLTNQYHLSGGLYLFDSIARMVNLPTTYGVELTVKN